MDNKKIIKIIEEAYKSKPPYVIAAEKLWLAGVRDADLAGKIINEIDMVKLNPVRNYLRDIKIAIKENNKESGRVVVFQKKQMLKFLD